MRNLLQVIVHHNGEVITGGRVFTGQNHIAQGFGLRGNQGAFFRKLQRPFKI
jgi:hypothetical protein